MMKVKSVVTIAVFGLLFSARPSYAHHSFLAEFDQTRPLTVTGVVTRIDWINPHALFDVDAQDKNGKVVKWSFETATPSALNLRGWKKESVKVGDRVTVQGYLSKHGSSFAAARSVMLPDGRTVFTGTMDDGGPGK
jgi:uncharacterized protein DUF6152